MRKIGVIGQGEVPTAEEGVNGMAALNAMLDAWSVQRLMVPHVTRRLFNLTTAPSYTIGPSGATFISPRPESIERAGLVDYSGSLPVEYPLDVLDYRDWADVDLKTLAGSPAGMEAIYYDNSYPNGTIYVWPVNTVALGSQLALYSWEPIASAFTSLAASIDFQPGYQEAIIYNLAVRIADEYGVPVSQSVATMAQITLANVKSANVPRLRLRYSKFGAPPMYNVYSDDVR